MAGKWSFLKDKLPPADEPTPDLAAKLAQHRELFAGDTLETLSQELTKAREEKDAKSAELSDLNISIMALERLIIEKLESAGIESVTAGGYKLTPSIEPVFKKVDGGALRVWCVETGQEDLLTVNANTLTSLAKELFLSDGAPPPGVELTGTYTKLSRTKAR